MTNTARGRSAKWRALLIVASSLLFVAAGSVKSVGAENREGDADSEAQESGSEVSSENLTGQEMLQWVEAQGASAESAMSGIRRLTEQAGKEKDTIKLTCLDDKMMQMSLSLNGIEERTQALRIAVAGGDLKSARQNFEILKIYFSRTVGLSSEAENCLGESDVVLGKTETTMLISGDVTVEDPSGEDIADDLGVEQPAQISGFY